ncbi:MAG: Crp/Fnr family transcriptional regulator [Ideonella sp.]|jgi:CRP-like cAMP-binding protein|nr:Crp/Fnr family transcriptional regulator [Ideonella sp.]
MLMPTFAIRPAQARAPSCRSCPVRASALFGALDDETLDRVHGRIDTVRLQADALLYDAGATGSHVYTVRSGLVRLERITEAGDRRIVRLAGRGILVGPEALLRQPYGDDAVACTDVELCRIPRALLDDLGPDREPLARALMTRWQAALDDAARWNAEFGSGSSYWRVLQLLRHLVDLAPDGDPIWLPRREQIGMILGMTEETASRMISRLRREGAIEFAGPREARIDPERLEDLRRQAADE